MREWKQKGKLNFCQDPLTGKVSREISGLISGCNCRRGGNFGAGGGGLKEFNASGRKAKRENGEMINFEFRESN